MSAPNDPTQSGALPSVPLQPIVLRPVDWLPSALSDKLFEEAWRAKKWSLANATPTADYENAKLFWDRAWQMSRVALTKNPTVDPRPTEKGERR